MISTVKERERLSPKRTVSLYDRPIPPSDLGEVGEGGSGAVLVVALPATHLAPHRSHLYGDHRDGVRDKGGGRADSVGILSFRLLVVYWAGGEWRALYGYVDKEAASAA